MMTSLRRRLARAFRQKAKLAQAHGRWAEALSNLNKAAALDPGNPAILLQIGNSLAELEDFEAAEAAFRAASAAAQFVVRALVGLAGVCERKMDWETASERWEVVLREMALKEDAPGDDWPISPAYALMHFALCRERVGDGSRADRDFGLALALDPKVRHLPEAVLMRARMLGGSDPHASRKLLQSAVRRYPADRTIRFELMVAVARSGDRVAAARHANDLLRLAPGDPGVLAFAREHNLVLDLEAVG